MKICQFEGCGKQAICKGLCAAHYQQQRAGKPLTPLQVQYHGYSEVKRFLMRVEKGEKHECWPWTGSRMNENWHGQWRNQAGEIEPTHRATWRLFCGEIPEGMHVLHKCDNPICVNPDHLFLGTRSDNAKDMWAKKRARPKAQHGEGHGCSKLTDEDVRRIRESSTSGVELAEQYGVGKTTISSIRLRKTWRHI